MPGKNTIEAILFKRVQEDDEAAFEILYKQYYSGLCIYAVIFVRYADVAEEIVHETFIRIWEKRASISIDTSFKAYIFRSVHNNCINYLKKDRHLLKLNEEVRKEILEQIDLNARNLDTNIINRLVSEEFNREFTRVFESLPPQCREIFLLCRNEQLSYSEIAERKDISVNTVKTQMKRALNKLGDNLARYLKK